MHMRKRMVWPARINWGWNANTIGRCREEPKVKSAGGWKKSAGNCGSDRPIPAASNPAKLAREGARLARVSDGYEGG